MKKGVIISISAIVALLLIGGGALTFALVSNAEKNNESSHKPTDFTISLNHTILTLKEGESETLVATTSKKVTLTWKSADEEIATVTQEGLVTAIKEGTTVVTASANKKSASCTIEVIKDEPPIFTIELNETRLDLKEGEEFDLEATTSEPATVTWSSNDSKVATVDQSGHVVAVSEGNTFITATANNVSAHCEIYVTKEETDTPITLSWGTHNLTDIDELGNGEEKGPYQLILVTSSASTETFTGRFTVSLSSQSNNEYRLIDYLYVRVYDNTNKENPLIDINSTSSSKTGYTDIEMTGNESKTLYLYIGLNEVAPYIYQAFQNESVFVTFDWSNLA